MNTTETNREIDKLMYKEIVEEMTDCAKSFYAMRDELMLNFDRAKVVDITSPVKVQLLDLKAKIDRFNGRLVRGGKR